MSYQLLIAVEVFDFAQTLPKREQQLLWKRFREIGETPHRFVDYVEPDKRSACSMSISMPGLPSSIGRMRLTGT